jgi:FAD/FMN-containing dehydrogenase
MVSVHSRTDVPPLDALGGPVLAYGQGRSYGDCCLNEDGVLLETDSLDRFIHLDEARGSLRCESGVTLEEVLRVIVPRGFFLPVTPGTKYVSVAGAVANDVHGKNHHAAGSFGNHVTAFELVRSDGSRQTCTPSENSSLFRATIGGLGLTGLITWVEFKLARVAGEGIELETIRLENLEHFFELSEDSDRAFENTVAWIDTSVGGANLGRGLLMRGNPAVWPKPAPSFDQRLDLGVVPPFSLVNRASTVLFNRLHLLTKPRRTVKSLVHFDPFFYPLDKVGRWNRLYGPRGFLQYQCVVPLSGSRASIRDLLERISSRGPYSSLAVMKHFGSIESPGLLSFCRPGVTLALDFPATPSAFALLDELDDIVRASGGAVYLAKDARLSPDNFRAFYPQWQELEQARDPAFSSSLWRRLSSVRSST